MSIWLYLTEVLLGYHEQGVVKDLEAKKKFFLTAPVDFYLDPNNFFKFEL